MAKIEVVSATGIRDAPAADALLAELGIDPPTMILGSNAAKASAPRRPPAATRAS